MAMKVKVRIENLDETIEAEVGQDLRTALLENNVKIYPKLWKLVNCHGHSSCGSCQIIVEQGGEGLSDRSLYEKVRIQISDLTGKSPIGAILGRFPKAENRRLACMTRVYQDAVIRTFVQPPDED